MQVSRRIQLLVAVFALLVASFVWLPNAFAATLTSTSVVELGGASSANPMIAADGQSLAVEFKTVSAGATTVSLAFGSAWTTASGSVNATQTISNTGSGCTTLFTNSPTALPGGSIAASGSGTTINITGVTALSASTVYCTELTSTSAVTNPSAGAYGVTVTAGSDSQTVGIDVLSSGANAYSITGTVAPTFTMSLSGTTDSFSGNLTAGSNNVSTGITATISTNAASGWDVWAEDSNAGLKSTQAGGKLIPSVATGSNHTMTAGTESYGLGNTTSAYTTPFYTDTAGNTAGGLSNTAYNEIATSASGASNVTFTTKEIADISGTTPPATDYTDTVNFIGAGSF